MTKSRRELNSVEILVSILLVLVLVVPLTLLVAYPENSWIKAILGEGRIFLMWVIVFSLIYYNREKLDALIQRRVSRRE
jgi:hypothetical protein